jgi:hypothetical protein
MWAHDYSASGLLCSPAFEPPVERVYRAKGQLCGSVYVCYARLQLQKILPGTLFVGFGIGLVAHADQHSHKTGHG